MLGMEQRPGWGEHVYTIQKKYCKSQRHSHDCYDPPDSAAEWYESKTKKYDDDFDPQLNHNESQSKASELDSAPYFLTQALSVEQVVASEFRKGAGTSHLKSSVQMTWNYEESPTTQQLGLFRPC